MREICTLRAMRRELETWPWENCEPVEQSKELDWKPSPYSARQFSTLPPDHILACHHTTTSETLTDRKSPLELSMLR